MYMLTYTYKEHRTPHNRKESKMKKEHKEALINEMETFGKAYLGKAEIRGEKVVKEYKALNKEVGKRYPGAVLCWDGFGTGEIWIA